MHKQLRVVAVSSPPDVEKLLRRLKDAGINLGGAGGSNIEYGGEFAFGVDDADEAAAIGVLEANHYPYRLFEHEVDPELTVCWIENRPGALHECVSGVASANLGSGRIIRDILIGLDGDRGIVAQIFSEQVRTTANTDTGGSES